MSTTRGTGRTKPRSSQIDWTHPLTRGLKFACILNEGAGRPVDLVTNIRASAASPWIVTPKGAAFAGNGSSEANFGNHATWIPGTGPVSIVLLANPTASGTTRAMFSKRLASGGFAQVALTANVDSVGNPLSGSLGCFFRNGATGNNHAAVASVIDGKYHTFGCVMYSPLTISHQMYVDGLSKAVSLTYGVAAASYSGTDNLNIGSGNATQYFSDNVVYAYYWPNRALSAYEMAWLADEPYAFIKTPNSIKYFVPGSNLYTSTVNGSIGSWAGATVRITGVTKSGSINSWSATIPKETSVSKAASIDNWVGSPSKITQKPITASVNNWAATLSNILGKVFTASIDSWAGSLVRSTYHSVSASIGSWTGIVSRVTSKIINSSIGTWIGAIGNTSSKFRYRARASMTNNTRGLITLQLNTRATVRKVEHYQTTVELL